MLTENEATVRQVPSHSRRVFDLTTSRHLAYWAAQKVKDLRADAIVAAGHSGLVLAGAVGLLAHVPVFAVRKDGEERHCVAAGYSVSGIKHDGKARRWVWLDDFLASGGTFTRSAHKVYEAGLVESRVPVAILSYQECREKSHFTTSDLGPTEVRIPQFGNNL